MCFIVLLKPGRVTDVIQMGQPSCHRAKNMWRIWPVAGIRYFAGHHETSQ
jgi:hypothetical protein